MATVAKRAAHPGRTRRKSRQRRAWPALRRLLFGPLGLVLLIAGVVWYLSLDLADLQRVSLNERQPEITLQDRAGVAFARFGDSYGEYLPLAQISPWLPKAVVAIEDRRFYQHPGIDPIGIGRAFVRNVRAGRVIEGGSTISQQLAKMAFLTPERSFLRKAKEALYTLWIEARFDKAKILELYLNRAYLGSGAYGVDAAARRYFAKPASDLTLAEAAMLFSTTSARARASPRSRVGAYREGALIRPASMAASARVRSLAGLAK